MAARKTEVRFLYRFCAELSTALSLACAAMCRLVPEGYEGDFGLVTTTVSSRSFGVARLASPFVSRKRGRAPVSPPRSKAERSAQCGDGAF